MKVFYCAVCGLFLSTGALAQGLDVPLFEDDIPNLGRQAKPLEEIHLTPDELPDVKVTLDDTKPVPQPVNKASTPKVTEPVVKPKLPHQAPLRPGKSIALSKQQVTENAAEMDKKLNSEIQKYLEARAREELEKETQEKIAQEKKKQAKVAEPLRKEEAKMPDSLTDLFGKTHDVHAFEISGFALGMTPDEVAEIAKENGYSITKIEHGIPLHRTSFYEHNCRRAQVRRVQALQDCIIEQARNDEVYYISSVTMAKPETAEYVQVLFSTHATDNVAYKIYYENEGDNSLNFTRKNLAKKIRRRDAFWNMVFENYGYPDDPETIIWGDQEKAYMMARMQGANYNAYLILEDKEIPDGDYKDAHEQKDDLHYKNTFTFAEKENDED